jgi:hypothetical protein
VWFLFAYDNPKAPLQASTLFQSHMYNRRLSALVAASNHNVYERGRSESHAARSQAKKAQVMRHAHWNQVRQPIAYFLLYGFSTRKVHLFKIDSRHHHKETLSARQVQESRSYHKSKPLLQEIGSRQS